MIFFTTGFIFWRSSGELYFRSSLPLILVDWAPQSRGLREARPEKLSFTFLSEMCTPKNNFRQTSYFIFLAWSFSQSVSFIPQLVCILRKLKTEHNGPSSHPSSPLPSKKPVMFIPGPGSQNQNVVG